MSQIIFLAQEPVFKQRKPPTCPLSTTADTRCLLADTTSQGVRYVNRKITFLLSITRKFGVSEQSLLQLRESEMVVSKGIIYRVI